MGRATSPDRRAGTLAATPAVIATLVGALFVCWLLLVPQGGQPDEHSHLVRAAALVRGAAEADGWTNAYVLPDRYVVADPGCYAFQPTVAASCAVIPQPSGADVTLVTRAVDYPWGGHAVLGAAAALPALAPVWWARLAAAAIGTVLLTAALVRARRSTELRPGAVLVGFTPMAWSIVPAVNPSSMVTAGAAALWVALLTAPPARALPSGHRWLIAGAWAATAMPRRDSLVWACLIALFALALTGDDLVGLARRLGRGPSAVVVAATIVVAAWAVTSPSRLGVFTIAAPIGLVAADQLRHRWLRPAPAARGATVPVTTRIAGGVALTVLAAAIWFVVISTRPGGWDTDLTLAIINQTDDNLIEAIGVLGWLDTAVPAFVVFAWLLVVGALIGGATRRPRGLATGALLAVTTAVTAWTFELLQGNTSGLYWQGRYSLPLLVGLPLVLTWRPPREHAAADAPADDAPSADPVPDDRGVDAVVGVTAIVLLNVAAWSAARRWGVGTLGSYLPWRWDTAIQPVPVVLLLVAHAVASAGLAWALLRPDADAR